MFYRGIKNEDLNMGGTGSRLIFPFPLEVLQKLKNPRILYAKQRSGAQ